MAAETETYVPMIEFDEEDLVEFIRRRREEQDARSAEEAVARSLEWHRAAPGRFPERFLAAVGRAGSSPTPPRRTR